MTEVPSTAWAHDFDLTTALKSAPKFSPGTRKIVWHRIAGVVTHTFTHFPLELVIYAMRVSQRTPAPLGMRWVAQRDVVTEALPSLMRKVLAQAGQQ